ncbi:acetyltransferase [Aureobasidium pullulans]|uniref:Acetyltransferase n=1 Tax=Aureobasidium pullulans TaxID=5580 RepID=A0A4T0C3V2_AURPU|nr:acetyltransferase [Aureobasidium pullulans]
MAPKQTSSPTSPAKGSESDPVTHVLWALCMLELAAIYSPLSQLTLAPVYGSIPSSVFHHEITAIIVLLALTRSSIFSRFMPAQVEYYIPILASSIPLIQTFLFKYSTKLGVDVGPILTEGLTYYPLLLLSTYSAARVLLDAKIDQYLHASMGSTILGLSTYGFFVLSESFNVRKATPQDAQAVAELGTHVFTVTFGPVVTDVEDQILGFALLTRGPPEPCIQDIPKQVELQRIYLHPSAQGRGVGKLLASSVEKEAKEQGFENLWLAVYEKNQKAIQIYEKLGFKTVGTHDFVIGKETQTDLVMLKPL